MTTRVADASEKRLRPFWVGLWLQWTLANAIGWTAGWSLGWPAAMTSFLVWDKTSSDALVVAVAGLLVGLMRWVALRRKEHRSRGWAVMNAAGSAAAVAVPMIVVVVLAWDVGAAGYPFLLALVGTLIGLMQWFVLRRQADRSGWWVLANAAGSAMGWSIGVSLNLSIHRAVGRFDEALGFAIVGAVMGTLIGAIQWLVLRRRFHRAGWWVLASAVGTTLAMPVGGAAIFSMDAAIGGSIFGATTGVPLAWLLRQQMQEE